MASRGRGLVERCVFMRLQVALYNYMILCHFIST